ncbi:uncharacterized protein LOC126425108 [Schistocerca serialis cubense]|uniref:uncharacterized protein LOC126425108 n=1 Tax=Schistocerca serialis cubense TaxID=2023355 RepID=UPI00214E3FF4|nr:uncharacterized protein LOC126425108 [Schistocerca serialis cubense]
MDQTQLAVLALLAIVEDERRKHCRSLWTRQWIRQRDNGRGTIHMLHHELRLQDAESFRNFTRMDEDVFSKLLSIIGSDICCQDTNMRQSIKPLSTGSHFKTFPTGETFQSLGYAIRIAPNTLSKIIPETLQAILNNLGNKCIKIPNTANEWKQVVHSFNLLWQFPHCIGAVDGKKVTFRAPRAAGAYFRDYKRHNSIVLLAVVDAHYRFLYTNIGANGRVHDGAIFNQSRGLTGQ